LTQTDIYDCVQAHYPDDNLYPNDDLFPHNNEIIPNNIMKEKVVVKLEKMGFRNTNRIFQKYFFSAGLMYSINMKEIVGVESYLKIMDMFLEIGAFTNEDRSKLKDYADTIYYNNGYHDFENINNSMIERDKLSKHILGYDIIFTTNYDTVLDDILIQNKSFPRHIHGGFSMKSPRGNPNGEKFKPGEAYLIWDSTSEGKEQQIQENAVYKRFSYGKDFSYDPVSSQRKYLDEIENTIFEEFHIFGYSGENDNHINSRIRSNEGIKTIVVYVADEEIEDTENPIKCAIYLKHVTL
jgi:hypothetical protein